MGESESRVRAIVYAAGSGIITVNPQGTIDSFNRAAEGMFGQGKLTILGRNPDELLAWVLSRFSFSQEEPPGRRRGPCNNFGG